VPLLVLEESWVLCVAYEMELPGSFIAGFVLLIFQLDFV